MFTRCIFCHAPFPENQALAHLPRGHRVAFDPARGRLWVVCGACRRWSLAPIEERWEALEELEKLARDRARLLSQTDNIALLRAGELELVRVGRAQLTEEAWWRYGRELVRRRRASRLIQGAEVVGWVAASVATGGFAGYFGQSVMVPVARWARFGRVAWRGQAACPRCGTVLRELKFADAGALQLAPGEEGQTELRIGCATCSTRWRDDASFRISGAGAEHLLRRALAYEHFHGASEERIRQATRWISTAGSAEEVTRRLAREGVRLGALEERRRTQSIALEIAVNDDVERRLLELELSELERRWKEEEEIAAIVDRELTWLPGLDRLLHRLRAAP